MCRLHRTLFVAIEFGLLCVQSRFRTLFAFVLVSIFSIEFGLLCVQSRFRTPFAFCASELFWSSLVCRVYRAVLELFLLFVLVL